MQKFFRSLTFDITENLDLIASLPREERLKSIPFVIINCAFENTHHIFWWYKLKKVEHDKDLLACWVQNGSETLLEKDSGFIKH